MQDFDFYSIDPAKYHQVENRVDNPEYFANMSDTHSRESEHNHKRATRLLAFVIGLCITCFTSGLVIGIKFAGGPDKKIIDEHTRQAFSSLGQKESAEEPGLAMAATKGQNLFPKENFPYIVAINDAYTIAQSQKAASYLSKQGHTVIISQNDGKYRLFIGPYAEKNNADSVALKINNDKVKCFTGQAIAVKR